MKADYRAGYLYVLVHPSDPNLYKVGVTVLDPKKRLAQHNSQLDKAAGRIVQETGQKWELKKAIEVPDVYWAERKFWGALPFVDFPFRGGIEVEWRMDWPMVQKGLDAAARAGVRPPQPRPRIAKSRAWVNAQLEGTGITLTARRYPGPGWVAEYHCAKGHVFTEYTKEVVARKSCPCCVDWDWAEGYWGKGLRPSLRELEHYSLRPDESRGGPSSIKSSAKTVRSSSERASQADTATSSSNYNAQRNPPGFDSCAATSSAPGFPLDSVVSRHVEQMTIHPEFPGRSGEL